MSTQRSHRRRLALLLAIWLGPSALLLLPAGCIYAHYRISVPPELGPEARAAVMASLHRGLRGEPGRPEHPELLRELAGGGPAMVAVWHQGKEIARVLGHGTTVAEAVTSAAHQLADHSKVGGLRDRSALSEARIKVDLVVGRAPLIGLHPLLTALGINPGLEGLGVDLGQGREVLFLPDELVGHRLFGTATPLKFVPDFSVGLDFERADMLLAKAAALPAGGYGSAQRAYFRFRTESFLDGDSDGDGDGDGDGDDPERKGVPLALRRGLPPGPELTAETLRQGALAGGRFLVEHLAKNGRYVYQRDLVTGRGTDPMQSGPYSIPRHAGTTYFLAELYRITGEEFLREPIERAFAHLQELVTAGGCAGTLPSGEAFACVVDRGRTVTDLGSSALAVVALVEYHRATGKDTYDDLARKLTAWILFMQRADGSFAHRYDVAAGKKDETAQLLYYSGEAALALARMHKITGEQRYLEAAERALDDLIGWYDFFLGGFFIGEEHWTCMAAEAIYPDVKKDTYLAFCRAYGAFLRAHQPLPGEHGDQEDYAGSYNFTPFIVPQNTPAGSRTEAMISAYQLSVHHGAPDPALLGQVEAALRYVLAQQIRPESDYFVSPKLAGEGAVPASPVDRQVRIDYVQHVGSAMIRASELWRKP